MEAREESLFIALGFRFLHPSVPQRNVFVSLFLSLSLTPPPTFQPEAGGGQQTQSLSVWGGMCPPPPLYPEDTMPLLLPVLCPPPHHLSTAHARLQLATGSGQPPHTGTLGDFKRVPGTPAQFLVPHSPNPADAPGPSPAPAMAPGAPSSNPSPILAALLFSSLGKLSHPSGGPGSQVVSQQPSPCLHCAPHCNQRKRQQQQEDAILCREKIYI